MNNQNYNFSTNSSSSSNTSSSTQQFPMFGTNYQPTTQPQPQSQSPSMWANCYRPIPVQSDFQFQEYQQQQNAWSQQQFFQQQQNPFPQPQQFLQPQQHHFSSQPPFCSQPITPSTSQSSPKKTKKGKKKTVSEPLTRQFWNETEALSLAKCWIDISEDPAIGNNQDADGFWARVHEVFTNLHPDKPRTVQSVIGKWKDLRKKTKQFCGVMSGFESHRRSGVSDADIMKAALKEYESMYKKPFTHVDVYEFLKDKGKWKNPNPLGLGPKKRIADEAIHVDLGGDEGDEEADAFHANKDTTQRPPGRQAKQQRSTSTGEGSSKSSAGELASSLNENFSLITTKKVEAVADARSLMSSKQKKIDIDILKTTHDGLSPKEIEWLEDEKHAIRVKWGLL